MAVFSFYDDGLSTSPSSNQHAMPIAEVVKRCATALVAVASLATLANAAPQISSLSIRGLQIGGRTSITIDGSDLQPDPHIVVPINGLSAQISPDSTDTRVIVDI